MNTTMISCNNVRETQQPPPRGNLALCDFCDRSKAVLRCRADTANLCLACDREVHSTNALFGKHCRSLLCNSCGSSPASIFCSTESAALCQNCDWEAHEKAGFGGSSGHERRPLEGFCGVPCVGEFMGLLGLDGDLLKSDVDGFLDVFAWETPAMVLSMDDFVVSGGGVGLKAMGVPPLPKNRNAVCGKDKDEIIYQLRELAKAEPNFDGSLKSQGVGFQQQQELPGNTNPGLEIITSMPSYEVNTPMLYDFAGNVSDKISVALTSSYLDNVVEADNMVPSDDTATKYGTMVANCNANAHPHVVPEVSNNFQVMPIAVARELNSEERGSALSRYKEKKKTRRYDKHIRYESRKVRAESRTRVKGRFAKMEF